MNRAISARAAETAVNQAAAVPSPLWSGTFVRGYAVTMRPYLLFVSGITGIAGLACAGPLSPGRTLALVIAFFLSYGFGQALTDCFQTDTDALSSPYRPLVRGELRRRDVALVSLLGLFACGIVMTWSKPANLVLCAAAVAGLATYTWFKRRWWGGPFYNAAIVAVLFVIALMAGGGRPAVAVGGRPDFMVTANPALLIGAVIAVFFGYADFVLTGYFKDIPADRATGYHTFPVVFGMRAAAWVSDFLAVATLAGVVTAIAGSRIAAGLPADQICVTVLLLGGGVSLVLAHARLHRVTAPAESHRAIVPVVHAYILLLAAVAAACRPAWIPALAVFYAAFVLTLAFRPMKEQV